MSTAKSYSTFDAWMQRSYPGCAFARYADDAVIPLPQRKAGV